MGSLKEEWMDMEDEKKNRIYAQALGITYDEFLLLDLHSIDDSDNDGTLLIRFDESSSAEILKKIGADDTNSVRIDSSTLS